LYFIEPKVYRIAVRKSTGIFKKQGLITNYLQIVATKSPGLGKPGTDNSYFSKRIP